MRQLYLLNFATHSNDVKILYFNEVSEKLVLSGDFRDGLNVLYITDYSFSRTNGALQEKVLLTRGCGLERQNKG